MNHYFAKLSGMYASGGAFVINADSEDEARKLAERRAARINRELSVDSIELVSDAPGVVAEQVVIE